MTFNVESPSLLALFLLMVSAVLALLLIQKLPLTWTKTRSAAALLVVGLYLMALSGCGTAPLQVQTSPPVPAGLLTPPRPPVLLQVPSRSTTPGATTPSTPSGAPKTGSTTSA